MHEVFFNILEGKYEEISDEYSKELRELIKKMLDKDPEKRPSVQDIL